MMKLTLAIKAIKWVWNKFAPKEWQKHLTFEQQREKDARDKRREDLKLELEVANAHAKIRRMEFEAEKDYSYDMQVLKNRRNSWADELLIVFFVGGVIAHFYPPLQPYMAAGWAAMGYEDPPLWFELGILTIIVSTLGGMRILHLIMGGQLLKRKHQTAPRPVMSQTSKNSLAENIAGRVGMHEGFRDKVYKCPAGYDTIGYGFNMEANGLPEPIARALLVYQLEQCEIEAQSFHWFKGLNKARQGVIVELIFNIGLARFSKFKQTIAALAAKDYNKAADEMLDSKWASQVGKRATTLITIMRSGRNG